ncbi:SIMPL domain-containing protein [Flavobacteriales bacterium]|nr:SIMPL domain-containing protein [Flavobacteriales bacterium]MDB4088742.1 SIMPL domain-containing protein [Flavobacteriales bacterium]
MKKTQIILTALLLSNIMIGQGSGNINYGNNSLTSNQYNTQTNRNSSVIGSISDRLVTVTAKGLTNVKADSYVAIFSLVQNGNTADEVNKIMESRIKKAIDNIKAKTTVKTFVDMVSFVPKYTVISEKKRFSKTTYNEVPAGFELKKNIHIEFYNQSTLNDIVSVFAAEEIYNLIRVDCFSSKMEAVKKELMIKAKQILDSKFKNYESLLNKDFDTLRKTFSDGYNVLLPIENYRSFQAYNNSSINRKAIRIKSAQKKNSQYYQPALDKQFDFVKNPVVLEPVIQVVYEIKMLVYIKETKPNPTKVRNYYMGPDGNIKNFPIQ